MLDRYDQDLLLDYLEDELDAERRAQLEAMLAEDPQLAALLHEMARDRAALRSLPQAQAPGDLVHDVTQTLERRMLLEESVDDTTPIPISRAMAGEPTRSISWGRVIGLTGLAASVALAAGILVITFDDTLQQTANEFADNISAEAKEPASESTGADESADDAERPERLASREKPDATNGLSAPRTAAQPTDPASAELAPGLDQALADRGDTDVTPGANPTPPSISEGADDARIESFALGSTAAISVMQPRQQLVLLSDSPEVSLEQLLDFCVDNGIPVVKPDQQASAVWAATPQAEPQPELALRNSNADANADVPNADYALLINEEQLDTLVYRLNNNITLEPKRVKQGSLFSNQAALLEDLPEHASRYAAVERSATQAADDQAVEKAQPTGQEQADNFASQQAVKLRSPDLGSDYANTRNAYNLLTQQQSTYAQSEQPLADAQPIEDRVALLSKESADATAPQPQTEFDQESSESQAAGAVTLNENKDAAKAADEAEPNRDARNKDAEGISRRIDPSRGNWLSAHLPGEDTTPLLLSWREGRTDRPTKLVPVMIQRAEAEKVNTVRQRQQVEYAKRGKAEPSVAPEQNAEQPSEAHTPGQSPPAKPTE